MRAFHRFTTYKRRLSTRELIVLGVATFSVVVVVGLFGPALLARSQALASRWQRPEAEAPRLAATYYPNCKAAHSAGVYSIPRGAPGYRPELDADGDGLACEPHVGG